jgi:hypothetical protein
VARQTLYTWRERGRAALEQAFAPPAVGRSADGAMDRLILTLLVEGHAGERGIQRCLAEQGRAVSLGTISAVVTEAERRALRVMARPRPLRVSALGCGSWRSMRSTAMTGMAPG